MTITIFYRVCGMPVLALGAALFLSACELEIGDEKSPSSSSDSSTPTGNTGTGKDTGGANQNPDTDEPTDRTAAPGVPTLLSPGNNETVSGSKVTLVWTDAQGAVEFELAIQGLGSGGWQAAANPVTDAFEFSYSLNPAWTQYRWAVRSVGADGQKSGFTAWRSFSGTP
ncbi:MAG: hypothetical protein R6X19_09840 [Kiritimatiellia bacterium]